MSSKKTLNRVKFGKLNSNNYEECPEGVLLIDGSDAGEWQPTAVDMSCGYKEWKVIDYCCDFIYRDEEVSLIADRKGAHRSKSGWSGRWIVDADAESALTTKARLRRMVAEAIAEIDSRLGEEEAPIAIEKTPQTPLSKLLSHIQGLKDIAVDDRTKFEQQLLDLASNLKGE